jgi:hypothetical protein
VLGLVSSFQTAAHLLINTKKSQTNNTDPKGNEKLNKM